MNKKNDKNMKDIRTEASLGWNDIMKIDQLRRESCGNNKNSHKRTLSTRIAESIQYIREIPENF